MRAASGTRPLVLSEPFDEAAATPVPVKTEQLAPTDDAASAAPGDNSSMEMSPAQDTAQAEQPKADGSEPQEPADQVMKVDSEPIPARADAESGAREQEETNSGAEEDSAKHDIAKNDPAEEQHKEKKKEAQVPKTKEELLQKLDEVDSEIAKTEARLKVS